MNTFKRGINLLLSILLFATTNVSVLYGAEENSFHAVATYECIGLYFKSPDLGQCNVRFRENAASKPRQGYPLVYDPRDEEYRGSIVGLKPDTNYAIEITLDNGRHELACKTRNDRFPIGKTTYLEGGVRSKPLVVSESGSANGYHLITVAEESRATIDVRNAQEYACVIDADYVIVRGVEFKNAAIHGLLIKSKRHDNVIEDCRFTFWGRVGGPKTYGNEGLRVLSFVDNHESQMGQGSHATGRQDRHPNRPGNNGPESRYRFGSETCKLQRRLRRKSTRPGSF